MQFENRKNFIMPCFALWDYYTLCSHVMQSSVAIGVDAETLSICSTV